MAVAPHHEVLVRPHVGAVERAVEPVQGEVRPVGRQDGAQLEEDVGVVLLQLDRLGGWPAPPSRRGGRRRGDPKEGVDFVRRVPAGSRPERSKVKYLVILWHPLAGIVGQGQAPEQEGLAGRYDPPILASKNSMVITTLSFSRISPICPSWTWSSKPVRCSPGPMPALREPHRRPPGHEQEDQAPQGQGRRRDAERREHERRG